MYMESNILSEKLKTLRCCVVVPTYNNQKTLIKVLDGILAITDDILVINDGSTDGTAEILKGFPNIETIHFPKNIGKGNALRAGFKKVYANGFLYAITLDSDGQHFPEDIPVFVKTLENEEEKNVILIGARNMKQAGVPGKSSFGNRFSNFWFWVETGISLTDSQCGYRLYPLAELEKLEFFTKKFEFEIEVIVKAAWNGVTVKNVPVQVLYDEENRVSHFRPIIDFTRISILNTYLVFLTFFYIKPRDLFLKVKKKGFRRFILEDFLGNEDSAEKKAISIALGVFIGLSPFWGFHTVLVIFLAILLKLNKVIAFAFSNISLPPFIPFVFLASLQTGNWVLGEDSIFSPETVLQNFEILKHLEAYLLGSLVLATTSAVVLGIVGYIFFSLFEGKKILKNG